jgi:hypothetical protein
MTKNGRFQIACKTLFSRYNHYFKKNEKCSHNCYTGCLKICEFRIQSVVGKDPVELEKYLEK